MSKIRYGAVAFFAALAVTSGVRAADLGGAPYRAPVEEYGRPFSWTGLYVGANIGHGWSNADWSFNGSSLTGNTGSGSLFGVQVGYNWQMGRTVFGVEGDVASSWMDGTSSCPNAAFDCGHQVNWMASLRGRLGFTLNDNRTLLYGTAGAAWADSKWSTTNVATGSAFGSDFSTSQVGWVAGAGIEHMLTRNLSAKVEYLYYGFDPVTAPAGTLDTSATKLDMSSHVVRFGLNLKF